MMMRRYFFLFVFLFPLAAVYAIKPVKTYNATPETYGLKYTDHTVTSGEASLRSWWLTPSINRKNVTVLVSNSDFGNMSYLLYYGKALYDKGYDVVLYDYRGFGSSSDFKVDSTQLFYEEYIGDLASVYGEYRQHDPKQPVVFMGLSMGTIVTTAFVARGVKEPAVLIFDGYIQSIDTTIARIGALKEKYLHAPFTDTRYDEMLQQTRQYPRLIFSGKSDPVCPLLFTPRNATVVPFEGGHLEALKVMTSGEIMGNLYFEKIESFIDEHV